MTGDIRVSLLGGYDDPAISEGRWDEVLRRGETDVVYLTHEWQRAWWRGIGPGQLLLIAAEQNGRVTALAPLYAEEGMVYFVGSGDADYLDLIGETGAAGVLDAMLTLAASSVPGFCGFRLYAVREASRTGPRLKAAADRLGWWCYSRQRSHGARLDLITGRQHAEAAANGPKVSKRERYFSRTGQLTTREFTDPDEIRQRLTILFDQHTERWAARGINSRFADSAHRGFLEDLVGRSGATFRPRLTWLEWQDRAIACEFAWIYRNEYVAVASSFAPDLERRSPGQVLQRQTVLAALRDELVAYDFGEGAYPYKLKYSTELHAMDTWELYPQPAPTEAAPC